MSRGGAKCLIYQGVPQMTRAENRKKIAHLIYTQGLSINQAATLLKKHPDSIRKLLKRMREYAPGGARHLNPKCLGGGW